MELDGERRSLKSLLFCSLHFMLSFLSLSQPLVFTIAEVKMVTLVQDVQERDQAINFK